MRIISATYGVAALMLVAAGQWKFAAASAFVAIAFYFAPSMEWKPPNFDEDKKQ